MVVLNLISLFGLSAILTVMGLFVLLKSRHDKTNQLFFFLVLSVVGWLLTNYFSNAFPPSDPLTLPLNRLVFILPLLCWYFGFLFSLYFTNLKKLVSRKIIIAFSLLAFTLVGVSASPLIVAGILPAVASSDQMVNQIQFGPLSAVYFGAQVLFLSMIIVIFVIAFRRSKGADKARLQYVIAGILASFATVLVTNLLAPLLLHTYSFVNYGPYATLFLITGISYAIVKHRLFEIRRVVARSVTYVLLLISLGAAYTTIVYIFYLLFFPGSDRSAAETILNVVLAILLALTFQPLRRIFEQITDRLFYRDRYDSQMVLNKFSNVLVSEIDLDVLLHKSLQELSQSLRIQFAQIIVFKLERVYKVEHFGQLPKRLMVAPELRKLNAPLLVADELPQNERRAIMDEHSVRLSMQLKTQQALVGYVLLGDKLSGDIYSSQDIELLEIVSKQLAVAIQNATSYAEIQEFNITLQQKVEHATNRLKVANRHLKDLDKAKDEFISMASHQLRTPLTTIKGYLSMLLEGDAGQLSLPQTEFVNYAFGSSERMVNLISDLLNVSRLSAGRFLILAKPTDVVAMVRDEVRQLQSHATAKSLQLIFKEPDFKELTIELDEGKTRQVVMNFIDNAIYYTAAGSITVELLATADGMRLTVADTGIGVPETAKKHLFGKFFRADNAQSVRPDGTGLGLYLAKRVVEDQGGTIIFSSVVGKGSVFGFTLPRKAIVIKKGGHAVG